MSCQYGQNKVLFRILKTKGPDIKSICENFEEDIGNVQKLSEDELCKFWHHVKRVLLDAWKLYTDPVDNTNINVQVQTSTINIIRAVTSLALKTISERTFIPTILLEVVILLHSVILLKITNEQVKDEISYFLERWWKFDMIWKERVIRNAIKYLAEACKSSVKHVRRLYEIRSAISLLKSSEDIALLLNLVNKKIVISVKDGKMLLCYLFTLGKPWIMGIHYNIKLILESGYPRYITAYADLYATAWSEASKENKVALDKCVQDIIFHCFCTYRDSKGRGKLGKHLLAFLKALCNNGNEVRKMVIEQCEPLLWKYLKAPGSYVRCNAAEILFVACPMYDAACASAQGERHACLNKYYLAMTRLFNDASREIRLIAVRGICQVLAEHWASIPKGIIYKWLEILLRRTRSDDSSEVRKSVFLGLIQVSLNHESHATLKEFLPNFSDSMNDTQENVVQALMTLLLHIQSNIDNSYWDIVPLSAILELLEVTENKSLKNQLMELSWLRLFPKNLEMSEALKQITHVGRNIDVLRKLIYYSKDNINWDIATSFIQNVLDVINDEKRYSSEFVDIEMNIKRRKIYNKKFKVCNDPTSCLELSNSSKLKNIQILLDVVCLLLLTRQGNSDAAKDVDNKVIPIIVKRLPQFLTDFQKTPVNNSVIFLFSLIPPNSVPNANVFAEKFATQLNDASISDDSIITILHLLFKWEKIDIVFDIITKIFNESLNNVMQTSEEIHKEERRINETLALNLRILRHLLHVKFQPALINKYHNSLVECAYILWAFRSFVNGNSMSSTDMIREDIIIDIFNQYIAIISIMHKTDPIDAVKRFTDMIQWANSELIPYLPQLDEVNAKQCYVNVLKIILTGANSMVQQLKVTPMMCCKIVLLYCNCFVSRPGIIFVKEAFDAVLLLLKYGKAAYENEEHRIISVVIPKLLSAVMIIISKYSEKVLVSNTNNLHALPLIINGCFLVIDNTSKNHALYMSYMVIVFNTVVTCVSRKLREISKDESTTEANLMNIEFPYVSEQILKIILRRKKNQQLCMDVLTKAMAKYANMDRLAALLITKKMIGSGRTQYEKSIRKIALLGKLHNEEELQPTAFDRAIYVATMKVIEEILDKAI